MDRVAVCSGWFTVVLLVAASKRQLVVVEAKERMVIRVHMLVLFDFVNVPCKNFPIVQIQPKSELSFCVSREGRRCMASPDEGTPIKYILLDIEGTTTPISFVAG